MSKRIVVRCQCGAMHQAGQGCRVGNVAAAIQQGFKDRAKESREVIESRRAAGEVRESREAAAVAYRRDVGRKAAVINRRDNAYKVPGGREIDPTVLSDAPTVGDIRQSEKERELADKWFACPKETLTRAFSGKVR